MARVGRGEIWRLLNGPGGRPDIFFNAVSSDAETTELGRLGEAPLLTDADIAVLVEETGEDVAVGAALGGPAGIAIGGALGILTLGATAYVLYSHSAAAGGGGSGPTPTTPGQTSSPFFQSAEETQYGEEFDRGPQRDESDWRPKLNLQRATRPQALKDISGYFGRNAEFNSTLDWDGYYIRHFGSLQTDSGTRKLGGKIEQPIMLQWGFDDHTGIYLPEILAVHYSWPDISGAKQACFSGAWVDPSGTFAATTSALYSNSEEKHGIWDPNTRDQLGLLGLGMTLEDERQTTVDLRNTRGDGIIYPLSNVIVHTTLSTFPFMSILLRYRRVDWQSLNEYCFKWIQANEFVGNWNEAVGNVRYEILGIPGLIEYAAWYLFWAGEARD